MVVVTILGTVLVAIAAREITLQALTLACTVSLAGAIALFLTLRVAIDLHDGAMPVDDWPVNDT
jgi:hypothetical protein